MLKSDKPAIIANGNVRSHPIQQSASMRQPFHYNHTSLSSHALTLCDKVRPFPRSRDLRSTSLSHGNRPDHFMSSQTIPRGSGSIHSRLSTPRRHLSLQTDTSRTSIPVESIPSPPSPEAISVDIEQTNKEDHDHHLDASLHAQHKPPKVKIKDNSFFEAHPIRRFHANKDSHEHQVEKHNRILSQEEKDELLAIPPRQHRKQKMIRFAKILHYPNVFFPYVKDLLHTDFYMKGQWQTQYFRNQNPLILELGCGHGEYSTALASLRPNANYIGVDVKAARLFVGATHAIRHDLTNVAFLQHTAHRLGSLFAPNEVGEIWLPFSDPQTRRPEKIMTSKSFIDEYKSILEPRGIIHVKTDNDNLYQFTLNEIKEHGYTLLEAYNNVYDKSYKAESNVFSPFQVYNDHGHAQAMTQADIHHVFQEYIDANPSADPSFHYPLLPTPQEALNIKTRYEDIWSGRGSIIKYCKFMINSS